MPLSAWKVLPRRPGLPGARWRHREKPAPRRRHRRKRGGARRVTGGRRPRGRAGQRERRRPRRQSGGQRQPKLSLLTLGLASPPQVWAGEAPLTASPRRRAHLGGVGRPSPGGPGAVGFPKRSRNGPHVTLADGSRASGHGALRAVPELSILDSAERSRWWPEARFYRKRRCERGRLVGSASPSPTPPRAGSCPRELSPGTPSWGDVVTWSCF